MANSPGASLDRAFEELIQRVVDSTMATVRGELSRLADAAAAAVPASTPAPAPAAQDGLIASLAQSLNAILAPTNQTEIMAAALKSSATVAGAAGLFVRRGDSFSVWRSEGLAAEPANSLRSVSGSSASGAFKDLCDRAAGISAASGADAWPAGMNALAGDAANLGLMPIVVAGKVVAAIAAPANGSADSAASLEMIARVAGLSLETSATRTAAASAPAPAVQSAASQPTAEAAPVPSAEPATAPASHEAPAAVAPEAARGSFADMAPAGEAASTLPPPPDVSGLTEADQDAHKKAHRFARVAVQDLLSYHKGKIADGRNNRNLYDLLREDIEKTRENYQKKFASTAAAAFDYLHYEIVAKLAGNDPEVLGVNYPGPVNA